MGLPCDLGYTACWLTQALELHVILTLYYCEEPTVVTSTYPYTGNTQIRIAHFPNLKDCVWGRRAQNRPALLHNVHTLLACTPQSICQSTQVEVLAVAPVQCLGQGTWRCIFRSQRSKRGHGALGTRPTPTPAPTVSVSPGTLSESFLAHPLHLQWQGVHGGGGLGGARA